MRWPKSCSNDICQKVENWTPTGQDFCKDPMLIHLCFSSCEGHQGTKFSEIQLHNIAQLFIKGRFHTINGSPKFTHGICQNETLRFSEICLFASQELLWDR